MDREYVILNNIEKNSNLTQRELSQELGISLGSVNLLLNKMVKEGLIKIEKIPADRVLYMLTPKGIIEKVNKTRTYIKHHYSYINSTKEKIKLIVKDYMKDAEQIYLLIEQDEIGALIKTAINEINDKSIYVVTDLNHVHSVNKETDLIIVYSTKYDKLRDSGYKVVNILEAI